MGRFAQSRKRPLALSLATTADNLARGNMFICSLSGFGFGAAIAVLVIWLILKRYLPSYFSEKGRNLATKEDIAAITREVEHVRHEYNSLIEELKARNQLRMAALDRRLLAHQEAFTHWRSLVAGPDESGAAVIACQTWWERNCLYLEPAVRQAFVVAYSNAHLRSEFVQIGAESHLIIDAWQKVMAFPDILFSAVQLPPMSETEVKAIEGGVSPLGDG